MARRLEVVIVGDATSLENGFNRAGIAATGFEAKMAGFGASAASVGSTLTKSLTLPIIAGFGLAGKSAMDFEQSMTLIQTQAGATADEVKQMTSAIEAMGGKAEQTPKELAQGLYWIESAGYRGAAALDILKTSADLASVGQSDMGQTANALVSVMKAMPGKFKDAADAASQMNAIVGNGKMTMDDLNAAIGTGFLSSADLFGVSLQSVGSALADLTAQGIGAEEAATKLKMGMVLLGAPTSKASKILGDLGIAQDEVATKTSEMSAALSKAGVKQSQLAEDMRQPNGLNVAIQDLKKHLVDSGMSATGAADVIAKAFGGGKTGTAVMAMVNDAKGLQTTYDNVGASAANFGANIDIQSETSSAKWHTFLSGLQTDLIKVGDAVLPAAISLGETFGGAVGKVSDAFAHLNPQMQSATIQILLVVAALGPLAWTAGKAASAVSSLAAAFKVIAGLSIGGLSAVSGVLETIAIAAMYAWDAFAGSAVVVAIVSAVETAVLAVSAALGVSIGAAAAIVVAVVAAVVAVIAGLIYWFTHFDEVNQAVSSAVGAAWEWLGGAFSNAGDKIKGVFSSVLSALSQLPYQVGYIIGYTAGTIVNAITGLIGWLAGAIPQIPGIVGSGLAALPGIASGAFWAVVNAAYGAMSGLVGAVWSGIGAAAGAMAALPGALLGAIGDLSGTLYGAGQALIQGLISGIGSMAGAAYDAIAGLASGLKDGFLSAIGAKSPSRVFAAAAQFIPHGVAVGVTKAAGVAVGAVKNMAAAMTVPINSMQLSPALVGSAGIGTLSGGSRITPNNQIGSGSGGTVVNIYGNIITPNPEDFSRQLAGQAILRSKSKVTF